MTVKYYANKGIHPVYKQTNLFMRISKMTAGMECLKLIFISGLLIKVMVTGIQVMEHCPKGSLQFRLPADVAVCRHYNVKIILSAIPGTEEHFWVLVTYFIEIYKSTQNISMHFYPHTDLNDHIERTILTRHTPKINAAYVSQKYSYCPATQILAVLFETDLSAGNYTMELQFRGILKNNYLPGFSKVSYFVKWPNTKALYTTSFFWDARRLFPCWDEPGLIATFNISIRHPPKYRSLSNMRIRMQREESNEVWTDFHTTPFLPTYLVGIAVLDHDLARCANHDESIIMWGRPEILKELQHACDIAILCANYISDTLNLGAMTSKMDHVVIPSSSVPTKKSWGLYTYKESEIVVDQDQYLFDSQNFSAPNIARRVAHHWVNDIVGPAWWNYMWINDGIATFLGLYVADKVLEKSPRVMERFVVEDQQLVMSKDILSRLNPVMHTIESLTDIHNLFSGLTLKKAVALIRMMYHIISDKSFWKGVRNFLEQNRFRSIIPASFWKGFHDAVSEKLNHQLDNWELEQVMTNWLTISNYPVVYVKFHFRQVTITSSCLYNKNECNPNLWWLPITYTTKLNINFNETLPKFWLKPWERYKTIDIGADNWIIVNLQQTGYYRVNYEMKNWERLIHYLNSSEYTNIHPVNRAQLIDDSYYLMLAGHLDCSVFLGISKYLKKERDYIAWYPMKRILSSMSIFLRHSESAPFKKHMNDILNKVVDEVGFGKRVFDTHFTKLLRLLVLELACMLDNSRCLAEVDTKLHEFLKDPSKSILSQQWKDWILCTGMKIANKSTWLKMTTQYMFTQNFEYIEYMTCMEDSSVIIEFLQRLKKNKTNYKLQSHEVIQIVSQIIEKHVWQDKVLNHVIFSYNTFRDFTPSPLIEIIIDNVYKTEQFETIKEFVNEHTFRGTEEQEDYKENLLSKIADRSNKISTELKILTNMFKSHTSTTDSV